jgi:hypothetical protein
MKFEKHSYTRHTVKSGDVKSKDQRRSAVHSRGDMGKSNGSNMDYSKKK